MQASSSTEASQFTGDLEESQKAATPPLSRAIARRISVIREQQLKELQLKLFPEWPDDRRGAPNSVIAPPCSASFEKAAGSELPRCQWLGP